MGHNGYVSVRPTLRAMTRMTDGAIVLVNLQFARTMVPIANGVRIEFGPSPQDRIDVKDVTIAQIRALIDSGQAG